MDEEIQEAQWLLEKLDSLDEMSTYDRIRVIPYSKHGDKDGEPIFTAPPLALAHALRVVLERARDWDGFVNTLRAVLHGKE